MDEVEIEKDGLDWKAIVTAGIKLLIPFVLGGLTVEITTGNTTFKIQLQQRVVELRKALEHYNPKDPVLASPEIFPVPRWPAKGPQLENDKK